MIAPAGPRFVAYFRVSTDRQGRSGLGLDAQLAAVAQHAAGCGGLVAAAFEEVESGRKGDLGVVQQMRRADPYRRILDSASNLLEREPSPEHLARLSGLDLEPVLGERIVDLTLQRARLGHSQR